MDYGQGFYLTCGTSPENVEACAASRLGRMKALVVAMLLLAVACSDNLGSPPVDHDLSLGIVESVEKVELRSPILASVDGDKAEPDPRFGHYIVVQLDDGRTVILVYTGVRRFQAGQRVRVHVNDVGPFMM